jgi:hypothetical protein
MVKLKGRIVPRIATAGTTTTPKLDQSEFSQPASLLLGQIGLMDLIGKCVLAAAGAVFCLFPLQWLLTIDTSKTHGIALLAINPERFRTYRGQSQVPLSGKKPARIHRRTGL